MRASYYFIVCSFLVSCASQNVTSTDDTFLLREPASGGSQSGGGGGTEAGIEFTRTLNSLVQRFTTDSKLAQKFPEFTVTQLKETLKARVLPVPQVFLEKEITVNGKKNIEKIEVGAANFRDQWQIQVNKSLWPSFQQNECRREILVLHEALGLLNLEKDTYPISSRLCRPYGTDYIALPIMPPQKNYSANKVLAQSSNEDFVRTERHIKKSDATRDSIDEMVRNGKNSGAFSVIGVESETEWIVIMLWSKIDFNKLQ